jgi:transposase
MREKPRLVVSGRDGAVRRRSRRPDVEKAQIVAESHSPGVKVSDVARRHGVRPAELSRWRGLARAGRLPPLDGAAVEFAPIVVDGADPAPDTVTTPVEIAVADAVVRVAADCSTARIAEAQRRRWARWRADHGGDAG